MSDGSGIRDPESEILRIEFTRTDRSQEPPPMSPCAATTIMLEKTGLVCSC